MKKILLLNASHNDVRLILALKNLGCYVITTGNRPYLEGHKLADEYVYCSYYDKEKIYDIAKKKQVNAICPCCNDVAVITAAYVSEKLGLKGQDSYSTTLLIHNKDKFKSFISKLTNVNSAVSNSFSEIEQALKWAKEENKRYPVIVKPVDLSAGNGISKANSLEELIVCIKKAFEVSYEKRIIIEEFIEGTQHAFCTFLVNKKIVAICSNDEYSFINPYRVEVDMYPASDYELVEKDLSNQIEHIAEVLDLEDGIFSVQYILKDGKPYILEAMRRVLGNLYSIPAEGLGEGFNWDYWQVRAVCDFGCEKFPQKVLQSGFWAYRALISEKNGIYKEIYIPKEIKKYIYESRMIQKKGYMIKDYKSEPIGFLFMRFSSREEMVEVMINRYYDIKVVVE